MYLLIHELVHVLFSLFAGLAAYIIVFKNKLQKKNMALALTAALVGGVLIDLDHLFDYYIAFGFNFNLSVFLRSLQFVKNEKIYVPFHAWEYAAVLIGAAYFVQRDKMKLILYALGFGVLLHLAADTYLNTMPPQSYSILYRMKHNFAVSELAYPAQYERFLRRRDNIPSSL